MLHLPQRFKLPPQHKPSPLKQMTRQLDMSNVRRMILGVDIVMLQDALRVEIIDETPVAEIFMHILGFFFVDCCGEVLHAGFDEFAPL